MKQFKIKKGKHHASPWVWPLKAWGLLYPGINLKGEFYFTENSSYIIYDGKKVSADQLDWNKLTGIDLGVIPANEACLVGWRFDEQDKNFEVAPYFNIGKSLVYAKDAHQIVRFGAYEVGEFNISYNPKTKKALVTVTNKVTRNSVTRMETMRTRNYMGIKVKPYFGGNRTAPNNVEINLKWT